MAEAFYLNVSLEPHRKHSGSITGRRILFLAEVPIEAAKQSATDPDDPTAITSAGKGCVRISSESFSPVNCIVSRS